MRRNDRECLRSGEKTNEGTKRDEDAKRHWANRLARKVPQNAEVTLLVEMNPSLSASSQAIKYKRLISFTSLYREWAI